MILPQVVKDFLAVLFRSSHRKVSLFLLGLFLVLLPPQNAYSTWQVPEGEPLVRSVEIKVPELEPYPVNITGQLLPLLSARSIVIIDADSGAMIFSKNPNWQLAPASTTKMMTALVVLDNYDLSERVTIQNLNGVFGQTMELRIGDQLTVENLLYGLLVQSGNDAAQVLADHFPGGRKAFVAAMNQKASQLYMNETHFTNPSGIDALGHTSTVHDLVLLGRELVKHRKLAQIVATSGISITDVSGKKVYELENINQLVGKVPGVIGIKTGWTKNADECLVTLIAREEHQVIVALLGSNDRFGETKIIIDWVFANHQWQEIPSID